MSGSLSSLRRPLVVFVLLGSLLCFCLAMTTLGLALWSRSLVLADPTPLAADTVTPTLAPSMMPDRTPSSTPPPRPGASLSSMTATPPFSLPVMSMTEARLWAAELPQRDIRLLAERLGKTGPIPLVVHREPPVYVLGDETEAERAWLRAIEVAHTQGARTLELRAATNLAQFWRDQRKTNQARSLLLPIHDSFTEGFDTLDLIDARSLLDELS